MEQAGGHDAIRVACGHIVNGLHSLARGRNRMVSVEMQVEGGEQYVVTSRT